MIVVKNYKNGMVNFYVYMCKDFGFDFCCIVFDKNLYVVGLFKCIDCLFIFDGVAVFVISVVDVVKFMLCVV